MRLYNPTPENIMGGYDGLKYPIDAGHTVLLSDETGKWILERWAAVGLVDITAVGNPDKGFDAKLFIVKKTLEGLEKYLQSLHHILGQYIELDTEMKQQNVYGTVLKHKNVGEVSKKIEHVSKLIRDIEAKYGVSLVTEEYEAKHAAMMGSIDTIVSAYEADKDAQVKSVEQINAADRVLEDILKPIASEVLGG